MDASATNHPRDIGPFDLAVMESLVPDAKLLRSVVRESRNRLGFFPAHNPRAMEYPWILSELSPATRDRRILDVGAGVNVLPLMLADLGANVTTLDNHPSTRNPADRANWNEWGFLDYSLLDSRIKSARHAYESWKTPVPFDAIYSVSVIEHLPRAVRLKWIENFWLQLEGGGLLLLTVDLVSNTNALWNRCEGQLVEDPAIHGDFSILLGELQRVGFEIESTDIRREIPNCRVDIGFIRAKRK
jgi:SAM-dependent methyltransferase